ncbi:MAG TPA: hypothetical protein VGG60_11160 [Candidatus Binataceae bacterium]
MRKGKGHDLMRAHRASAGNPEPMSVSFALIAELARVDGNPLVYEDVLEMDLNDVLALEAEIMGVGDSRTNFQNTAAPRENSTDLSRPRQSSDSSPSDSPSQS